eukprot:167016-Prymnesium_polylepis.1
MGSPSLIWQVFAMYKTQRVADDEAFGDFCHRVTIPAIEAYMKVPWKETRWLGSAGADFGAHLLSSLPS